MTKHGIQINKTAEESKPSLKMGPATGKGTVTMEQITREVAQMQVNPLPTLKNAALPTLKNNPVPVAQFNGGSLQQAVVAAPPPQMSLEDQKNLKAFAKQAVLRAGPVVDYEATNNQETRAHELKELIGLGQEEFFDIFEMVPRTEMDVYDQKLLAGTHKLALV